MYNNDMSPCGIPSCRCSGASLSSLFIHDEAKTVSNIESQNLYPPSYSPSIPVASPTSGGQPALSFKGPGNPDYTQQPPDHVIEYWYHQLGLSVHTPSAETLSNSATLPSAPPPPVFDEISSRVSIKFIISHWICFVFEMYVCFEAGLLTDFL
jgi:hypothetical protein